VPATLERESGGVYKMAAVAVQLSAADAEKESNFRTAFLGVVHTYECVGLQAESVSACRVQQEVLAAVVAPMLTHSEELHLNTRECDLAVAAAAVADEMPAEGLVHGDGHYSNTPTRDQLVGVENSPICALAAAAAAAAEGH